MEAENAVSRNHLDITLGRIFAVLLSACAIAGLFVSGHLFDLMNTDTLLDVLRLGLAAYLVYAGFIASDRQHTDLALSILGISYLAIGILGLFDRTLGGLLPSGLTEFDLFFHIVVGAIASFVGLRSAMETNAPYRLDR